MTPALAGAADGPWLGRGLGGWQVGSAACLVVGAIGSAVYTLLPGSGYLVVGLVLLLLLSSPAIGLAATPGIPALPVLGFALFNALFMLRALGSVIEARTLLIHVLSLGTFVLSFTAWRAVVTGDRKRAARLLSSVALLAVVALLLGQIAEIAGLIDRRNLGTQQGDSTYVFRPGGMLNPNMTAAIAVLLLFAVGESKRGRSLGWDGYAAVVLVVVVVALTQSRTLIAALLAYLTVLGVRAPRLFLVVPVVIASALFATLDESAGEVVSALIERAVGRFDGSLASDVSNAERLHVMRMALEMAGRSPLIGSGYLCLVDVAGVSSHNQLVDLMVNFGAVGLIIGTTAFVLLYMPASAILWLVGLLPTLMFSHNFFDSAPFQACLGMALAVDREWGRQR